MHTGASILPSLCPGARVAAWPLGVLGKPEGRLRAQGAQNTQTLRSHRGPVQVATISPFLSEHFILELFKLTPSKDRSVVTSVTRFQN